MVLFDAIMIRHNNLLIPNSRFRKNKKKGKKVIYTNHQKK
jgi:hypothetical protein